MTHTNMLDVVAQMDKQHCEELLELRTVHGVDGIQRCSVKHSVATHPDDDAGHCNQDKKRGSCHQRRNE
jgi:hypothetical protein